MITVGFTDTSTAGPSGPIVAWQWFFGDGGTSTDQNPSHDYAAADRYAVRLIVTGTSPDGAASITKQVTVT